MAVQHEFEELTCLRTAETPLPVGYGTGVYDTVYEYGKCTRVVERTRLLTKPEKMKERSAREKGGRFAAYHRALNRKYRWLAWFPWLPTSADPSPPG
jgi:hypothetical protein